MGKPHTSSNGFFLLVLLALGCAAPISRQASSQITYTGPFSALAKETGKYLGETVILGGKIVDLNASNEGSELIVLQLPLDRNQRPADQDNSEGRYLIRSKRFLDPEIYKKETLLTVVGRLTGIETRAIGQFDYAYPLIQEVEIKLWPKRFPSGPIFHFGIGVGTTF